MATWSDDDEASDEELVRLAQAGRAEAFGVLFDRHHGRLHNYCVRLLGDCHLAEDAAAEAFARALKALPGFRPGVFASWLFFIAHNVANDHWRRRPTLSLDGLVALPHGGESVDEAAFRSLRFDAVLAELDRLPADQRDAITLRLAGYTPDEIAAALGKRRAAADRAYQRGKEKLIERLGDGGAR